MSDNILGFIHGLLSEKGRTPAIACMDDYRYLDNGHIDSLAFIKFLFRIEERFGIQFQPEEIGGEAIRSAGGLARLIIAKQQHI